MSICKKCGKQIEGDSEYCSYCEPHENEVPGKFDFSFGWFMLGFFLPISVFYSMFSVMYHSDEKSLLIGFWTQLIVGTILGIVIRLSSIS